MHSPVATALILLVLALAPSALAQQPSASVTPGPVALARAHSHNDYEHTRPLLDALDQGFCSVEADIHLVDGKLLVAHDRPKVRPERTLDAPYLEPLKARCEANKGHVYPGTNGFTLLIDIKADAEGTYRVLDSVLRRYRKHLTRFTPTSTEPGAITVILSGDRPTKMVAAQPERFCAIDGRMEDLDRNPPAHLIPLVSDSWRPGFGLPDGDRLTDRDRARLHDLVRRAHAQGRRIRFWGAPDRPWLWTEQRDAGVDLINTDQLPALAAFLRASPAP